jgi:hypothetical protein
MKRLATRIASGNKAHDREMARALALLAQAAGAIREEVGAAWNGGPMHPTLRRHERIADSIARFIKEQAP